MRSYFTDTIVRQRAASTTDSYGNVRRTYPGNQLTITKARVQPRTSIEHVTEDRDITEETLGVYVPLNADIIATDRILWDGKTYEVHGDLQANRGVTGAVSHAYLKMVRVSG
jgi:head-tail adaptor